MFPTALLAFAALAAEPKRGEFPNETLQVGGAARVYRLIVPAGLDLAKPAPLVVAFHGMGIDSKDLMPRYTKFGDVAARHGFIVAFPNAENRKWGLAPAKVQADLAFFDALVAKLSGDYKVDARRIYATGMSNGAYFAHVVGKERSTKVAAVAAHSGALGLQTAVGIRAERKFPVMIVCGDHDRIFKPELARDGRDRYQREGHEVKLVEIPGLGHMWSANASEEMWKFFAAHPLPGAGR